MNGHHLAQFNLARLKQPFEHDDIKGFRDLLDPIHALADQAPGFVWRLIADGGADATTMRPAGEDGIINFTVWESREALERFVYQGLHAEALRRRREWFFQATEVNVVMWWIPVGHVPTLEEALERLELLRKDGPSPRAFTYRDSFGPDGAASPSSDSAGVDMAALEQAVDTYCDCWSELDPARRRERLASVWADGGTYTDPTVHAAGADELVAHIGRVLTKRAGAWIERTSVIDVHHDVLRFTWRMVTPDGDATRGGIDFAELSSDGKIRRVIGFFGPPDPYTAPPR